MVNVTMAQSVDALAHQVTSVLTVIPKIALRRMLPRYHSALKKVFVY